MDAEFTDEQEQLRSSVRRFLTERAPLTYVRSMLDDERGTSPDVWSGLGELGAHGLLVPEEHGGAGCGMVDMAVVLEELGRAVHPGPFASSGVGTATLLARLGTSDADDRVLRGVADGSIVGTVALLEPGRRREWRAPTGTVATPSTAGTWTIDGSKVHVGDAGAADVLLVTAGTGGDLGVFAVEADAPGLNVTSMPSVDGTTKEASITLAAVPARRVGDGDASDAVAETVDRLHVATVIAGVGTASAALEMTVDYAKSRHQFGVPIGSFQAVQHLCADMLRAVELARGAAYYACWACDAADSPERHRAATLALAFATDDLYRVGADAIQVHAGIGFTWEHDIHLFYKRLLTLQHTGGGAVDQLEELASIALDPVT